MRVEDIEEFLNSDRVVKYISDNRISPINQTFYIDFRTDSAAKLHSLKYLTVAFCGNKLFTHGTHLVTFTD